MNSKKAMSRHVSSKYISYSGMVKHDGVTFQVNANKDGDVSKKKGVYNHMLLKGLEQLSFMLKAHGKVIVIRFDLHQKSYTDDNKKMADFIDKLKKNLIRKYGFKDIGYWWVREREEAQAQHYHCALMLDGNKVKTSYKVLDIVDETWKKKDKGNSRPHIDNPYHVINVSNTIHNQESLESPLKHHNSKAGVIWRLSYMAKPRSKGFRSKQAKDYSTSRLK